MKIGRNHSYWNRFIKDDNIDIIHSIVVKAYEPAFGIIGDPAKWDPHTR